MGTATSKDDIQRALGSINYVGKFIPNLAVKCKNTRSLLRKNVDWKWGPEHEEEWKEVKTGLMTVPVLAYFDTKHKTRVSTDASKSGLGAVLLQKHEEWKPVAYAARSLTSCKSRYAQTEKECLGLAFGCAKFHGYMG